MYKRFFSFFSALVLCAGITLGSLSFLPKSFAFNSIEFSDDPRNRFPGKYLLIYSPNDNQNIVNIEVSDSDFVAKNSSFPFNFTSSSGWISFSFSVSNGYVDLTSSYSQSTWPANRVKTLYNPPLNPFNSSISLPSGYRPLDVSFEAPPTPRAYYFDFSPFYFPELPYGYFDGHINSVDGSFNLDYPSSTITGSINQNGFDTYSLTLPNTSSSGEFNYNDTTGIGGGWFNTTTGSGTIAQTAVSTDTITLNIQDVPLTYTPTYNETARFRSWAVVSGSSYCYFVCDTRNTITGSLESVSGDKGKLRFSAVGADGVHYPFYCIEFAYDGTKLQTLQALPNGFTVDFIGGTLEQDLDSGIWSCDPLYHGFWLSDTSPPVVLSSLTDDTYKWLANPVFGEVAFTLNFLNSINESINNLNQSVTSSISNQTSTFQNMDAPSNFDPTDVNNMLEYGSLESDFQAPSTDDIFSVDSGTFTDGMGFWRDRMNELLFFSGSPALPMTIFSLTLGLAVIIIGRRVSGGGAA